jgi:hypothetical protein
MFVPFVDKYVFSSNECNAYFSCYEQMEEFTCQSFYFFPGLHVREPSIRDKSPRGQRVSGGVEKPKSRDRTRESKGKKEATRPSIEIGKHLGQRCAASGQSLLR